MRVPVGQAVRLATCVVLSTFAVTTRLHAQQPAGLPIDRVKSVYLACERLAAGGELDGGEIMRCSVVYEELKRRAFGGDFKRLKAWADAQIAAAGS